MQLQNTVNTEHFDMLHYRISWLKRQISWFSFVRCPVQTSDGSILRFYFLDTPQSRPEDVGSVPSIGSGHFLSDTFPFIVLIIQSLAYIQSDLTDRASFNKIVISDNEDHWPQIPTNAATYHEKLGDTVDYLRALMPIRCFQTKDNVMTS